MQWQIDAMAALQRWDGLAPLMRAASWLGTEEFFLLLIPFVYLCVEARLGVRLGLVVLLGDALNAILKIALHQPRPYWIDARIRPLAMESSYGLPSSHAQNAVGAWLLLAQRAQQARRAAWMAAAGLVVTVSLSRVFLGVHFISDVVAGWLIGALFLGLFLRLETPLKKRFYRWELWPQIAAVALVAAAIMLLGIAARNAIAGVAEPLSWMRFTLEARRLDAVTSRAGALFGLGVGWILARRHAPFDAGGPLAQRCARFAVGILVLLALWRGLAIVAPRAPETAALAFRFARYACLTLWVTFAAPWLFLRSGWAQRRAATATGA